MANPRQMSAAEMQNEIDLYETLLESLRFSPEYTQSSEREEFESRINELKSQLFTVKNPNLNRSDNFQTSPAVTNNRDHAPPCLPHNNSLTSYPPPPSSSSSTSSPSSSSSASSSSPSSSPSLDYNDNNNNNNDHNTNTTVNREDQYYDLGSGDIINSTASANHAWGNASNSTSSQASASYPDAFSFITMDPPQGSSTFNPGGQILTRKRPRASTGSHGNVNPHEVKSLRMGSSPQMTGPATPSTLSSTDMAPE